MLNILGGYKYVVDFFVIAALVLVAGIGIHKYDSWQQDIGEARKQAQWDADTVRRDAIEKDLKTRFQKEKDDALAQSAKNVQTAAALTAAAGQSGRVLDDTIKALVIAGNTGNVEANRRYTAALAAVSSDCQAAYRGMADKAQGHANDALMFEQAWPY